MGLQDWPKKVKNSGASWCFIYEIGYICHWESLPKAAAVILQGGLNLTGRCCTPNAAALFAGQAGSSSKVHDTSGGINT